jgi:hypothetical protein
MSVDIYNKKYVLMISQNPESLFPTLPPKFWQTLVGGNWHGRRLFR